MKRIIPLLILMSLWITEAVAHNSGGPPTNVRATPGDRIIEVTWDAPTVSDEVHHVTMYEINFATGDAQGVSGGANARSHTIIQDRPSNDLENGKAYTFDVEAVYDANGHTPPASDHGKHSADITVTPMIPAPTDFTATLDAPTTGDRRVTLSWTAPTLKDGASGVTYQYSQNGGSTWKSISTTGTGTLTGTVSVQNGISYTFRVRAVRNGVSDESNGLASSAVTLTPLANAPGVPGTLNVERVEDTAILTWNPPSDAEEDILRYEYSSDGGSTWNPTESTDTTYTVTGLEPGETYTFLVRAIYVDGTTSRIISRRSRSSNSAVLSIPRAKRRIIQECPVGWVRSDGFAGRNRRVLLYEVKLDMDLHNRVSIYKPVWVAIYVHPDEGLENLDGWKLQVAVPYNHHRDYLLTAENSVVVDAEFVEGGFAFIENPKENPFPMVGMGFTGSPVPGFDYRLYDDTGRKIDFGISCYKRFDIFQVLRNAEDPRVLRKVLLESFDWDQWFLRSEWPVPVPVNAPGAPSLVKKSVVGTWADLKKQ